PTGARRRFTSLAREVLPSLIRLRIREKSKSGKLTRRPLLFGCIPSLKQVHNITDLPSAVPSSECSLIGAWSRTPQASSEEELPCRIIGVGTTDEVAPPSEPSRPISGTRLSSWWLISKGDQPTHPDSFRVRAMDGSCCQGGQQTPNTS